MHIFYVDGLKIIHTGDLGCIPTPEVLEKMKNADVILEPINGHFTISSFEFAEILKVVKPRLAIPMHYYKADNNSGYPDGGQIDVFRKLVSDVLEVNDYRVKLDDETFKHRVLVFNKEWQ